ncbi:multiple RNA-binding domain-containing protein 1 [Nematocida major]|uniref:multiple RNA-binding domain-containing protein 1 n=1 Tax=Nematocida major TaxID=1912982 RepID=UPI002007DDA7|nr:multiple RNA-binding domain-containing protein 1 [Nematocida major]KAH9387475.1 multiple RNA-binding domain-containing protein 1 [Nematocida major]
MRIVAKNIPVVLTQEEVKKHFSEKGVPTDVRLLKTLRGESRGVAFLGYKTPEQADASILHYNKSYCRGFRLLVERAETQKLPEEAPNKRRKEENSPLSDGLSVKEMKEILELLKRKKENIWYTEVDEDAGKDPKKGEEKESITDLISSYKKEASKRDAEKVLETGEVFIHGIPYAATEEEVETAFSEFGMVAEVFMKHREREDAWGDGDAVNSGYAIVTFAFPKDAFSLVGKTVIFQGRNVKVLPSKGKPSEEVTDKNKSNLSHGKYNPVFFNFSAVLGVAAKEKKVSKQEILKDRGIGVGGRIALLQSELVERTKIFLKDEGIAVECNCKRTACTCTFVSKKSLLVKNIPYGTREGEIREFFKKYVRAVFSPSKTLLVLEYGNKSDASAELKANNFVRIRDQPVYVEFLKVSRERYDREVAGLPHVVKPENLTVLGGKESKPFLKVILKNVPFQAGRPELSELVTGLIGKDFILRIPVKADGTHRGFCFVETRSPETAQKLLEKLQYVHLYGRHIVAQPAEV